nr:uncharacterized protein LOC115266195 [Aedes albopictus]
MEDRLQSLCKIVRRLRTSLELLRAPPNQATSTGVDKDHQTRSFVPKNAVYAKVYANNKWTWAPGTVVERIARVMYNIWINDRKLIQSHVNQLKSRGTTTLRINKKHILQLQILLSECNLAKPSTIRNPAQTTPSPKSLRDLPTRVPSSESTSSFSEASSSSSTTTSSGVFQSAVESSPAIQVPRRSSRIRRPPQRFNAFRRY